MKFNVTRIIESEPNAFQGLTKTTFDSGDPKIGHVYLFTQPANTPKEGDWLEGEVKPDKGGRMKFTKAKQDGFGAPPPKAQERAFKADPAKLELGGWQTAFNCAAAAVRDFYTFADTKPTDLKKYKTEVVNTAITFARTIATKPAQLFPESKDEVEDDLPPVEDLEPPVEVDLDEMEL